MTFVDRLAESVVRQDARRELLPCEREQERQRRVVDAQRRRLADEPQATGLALGPDLHLSGLLLLLAQLLLGCGGEELLHMSTMCGEELFLFRLLQTRFGFFGQFFLPGRFRACLVKLPPRRAQ